MVIFKGITIFERLDFILIDFECHFYVSIMCQM